MDRDLTLIEHLNELRKRIIVSLLSLALAASVSFPAVPYVLKILKLPAKGVINKLAFFSPEEAFVIYIRIALLCGVVLAMPVLLYQVWLFVAPALEEKTRRHAVYFVLFCFLAFVAGMLFAYFLLLPPALLFLLNFASEDMEPIISAGRYIPFVVGLMFGCGLVFQMPIVSFILARLGIINARMLRKKYRYAIITVSIIAALITPTPDALNMMLLGSSMLLLYEISIWVAFFAGKGREAPAGGYGPATPGAKTIC